LYGWAGLVAGLDRADWLPALAPRFTGRTAEVECTPAAWDWIEGIYLTQSQRKFTDCFRMLQKVAKEQGWAIPSERTLQRRMDALPMTTKVFRREGTEGLKKLYPPQRRDRSDLHALQAVNADGHKCDVFVRWPDGTVGRPILIGFQDIYSSMMLSWRIARTEDAETVLLAFGDMAETYGLPDICLLDNGRAFAAKAVSGGTPNRYRFKVREGDMHGVMTQLGVEIRWAEPYHGQSKPIERAWQTISSQAEKDPRFEGAWTGNTIAAKPENYGSHAVPVALFEAVMAERIAEYNAQAGRRTKICGGKLSFEQAFRLSYQDVPVRTVRPEHSRLWLLAAEGVTARSSDGSLHFEGNRYWHESLLEYLGKKVVIRFDPDNLHAGLHVYRLDGAYVAHAPCLEDIGFFSRHAGVEQRRAAKATVKLWKEAGKARVSFDELVAMLPIPSEPEAAPTPKIVRPIFGNLAVAQPANDYDQEEVLADFGRAMRKFSVVPNGNGADD
jgi:transposase InsO family protein